MQKPGCITNLFGICVSWSNERGHRVNQNLRSDVQVHWGGSSASPPTRSRRAIQPLGSSPPGAPSVSSKAPYNLKVVITSVHCDDRSGQSQKHRPGWALTKRAKVYAARPYQAKRSLILQQEELFNNSIRPTVSKPLNSRRYKSGTHWDKTRISGIHVVECALWLPRRRPHGIITTQWIDLTRGRGW